MIPVTVEVSGRDASPTAAAGVQPRTYRFEVLDNAALTPSAMLVSIYQSLHQTNRAGEETSYRVSGEMGVKGPAIRPSRQPRRRHRLSTGRHRRRPLRQ